MNNDAGRGNWIFLTLRLDSGEDLPFFLDTGLTLTLLDKSLESKLGKRIGSVKLWRFGRTIDADLYPAPKLFLGKTPLMTASNVLTGDLREPATLSGRPIAGVLGMDCLKHYCVQFDFEARKIRFLDRQQMDSAKLGKAFPLNYYFSCPFLYQSTLIGGKPAQLLIDCGYNKDGALDSERFMYAAGGRTIRLDGERPSLIRGTRAWLPGCVWNGESYTNLIVGNEVNALGLRFLARHLVTFDFPNRTMYLRKITGEPIADESMQSAAEFLATLKQKGQMPGWSEDDVASITLEAQADWQTYQFRKNGPAVNYHYRVTRTSQTGRWRLQKSWQTDQNDHFIQQDPIR